MRDEWMMIRRAGSQGRQAGSPGGRVGKLLACLPACLGANSSLWETGDSVIMGRGLPHCGFGRADPLVVVGHVSSCLVSPALCEASASLAIA